MKTIYSVLAITCLLLFSCGDSTPVSITQGQDNTNSQEEFDSPSLALDQNIMERFPKNWVQVIPKNDTIVYIEYCGMGHPSLNITQKDSSWEIMAVYGQDAETWELIGITANEKTINNQTVQDGVFSVVKITYPDEMTYSVDYFWNKTTGIASFGDFFEAGASFADEANKVNFVIEIEECDF